jgi:hypothetical protein
MLQIKAHRYVVDLCPLKRREDFHARPVSTTVAAGKRQRNFDFSTKKLLAQGMLEDIQHPLATVVCN